MSLAEKLKQEGLHEGLHKGLQQKTYEVAKLMLELGSDDIFVLKVTSLTKEELTELKKQLGKL